MLGARKDGPVPAGKSLGPSRGRGSRSCEALGLWAPVGELEGMLSELGVPTVRTEQPRKKAHLPSPQTVLFRQGALFFEKGMTWFL